MNWNAVVNKVLPYIFKIETPDGFGTGFLCLYNQDKTICGIATANHVIDHADDWQQPIRLVHHLSGEELFIKESDRVIYQDLRRDSAVILFSVSEFDLPKETIPLFPSDKSIDLGVDIGWLGFPSIDPYTACFFCGNVSAHKNRQNAYLIDGVAINGVSGGPVMYRDDVEGVKIVGTVSAYKANRSGGQTLPGLLVSQDVSHFHDVIKRVRSIDEAKRDKAKEDQEKAREDEGEQGA